MKSLRHLLFLGFFLLAAFSLNIRLSFGGTFDATLDSTGVVHLSGSDNFECSPPGAGSMVRRERWEGDINGPIISQIGYPSTEINFNIDENLACHSPGDYGFTATYGGGELFEVPITHELTCAWTGHPLLRATVNLNNIPEISIEAPVERVRKQVENIVISYEFKYQAESCYVEGEGDPCLLRGIAIYVDGTRVYLISGASLPLSGYITVPYNFVNKSGFVTIKAYAGCGAYKIVEKVVYVDPEDTCLLDVGKPVNVSSGAVTTSETDFSLSGLMPINFTRYYNSKGTLTRGFGSKWGHSFDMRVISFGVNTYKVVNADGSAAYYIDNDGDKIYQPALPKGVTSKLTKNPDNSFKREFKDGTKEEFNTSGYLAALVDRNGNRITLTRGTGNRLTKITDPSGREINVTNDTSNRITAITLPDARVYSYTYPSGNLGTVTYPDSTTKTYEYTYVAGSYRLSGVKNEKGKYIEKHTYDSQGRAITSSSDGTNDLLTIGYASDLSSTVTDSLGRVTTYSIDKSKGRSHPTTISGPGCRQCGQGDVSYTYDEHLNITSITDGNGNVTTMTYDDNGNMLTKTEADGTPEQRTTTYTYNGFGQILTMTDPDGNVTTNLYDAQGNLLSTTDPQGHTTAYTYDATGLRTSMTDPRGQTTIYTYDQYGNLSSVIDPIGHTTSYTYDSAGRLITTIDPNNNTTTYEYDVRDRLKKVTEPGGGITNYQYDLAGNLVAVTDAMGNITENTYDDINRLIKVKDPQNNSINYTYDTQSNKTSMTIKDSSNNVTTSDTYTYDDHNRLSRTTHLDGTYTEQTYDSNGNVVTERDENASIYEYDYDHLNRLITITDPLGGITSYSHDKRNNLTSVTDANGNTTVYVYDSINQLISTISPDTGTTTYGYDQNGNLITKIDALNVTSTYTYDFLNRLTLIQFPDPADNIAYGYDSCANGIGRKCTMLDPSGTTSYEYSVKGEVSRETKIIDGNDFITDYGYDYNGNVTYIDYPSGRIITYTYSNNKVSGIVNNGMTIASNIAYKPFGGMTSVTYGNGLQGTIGYDQRYRVSSITTGTIQSLSYTYDNNGNITGIVNNLDPQKNKVYTYDALNRLATAAGPWGNISYSYDGVGNRQVEITGLGQTNYFYTENRLTSTTGEKTFNFSYDSNGNTTMENTRQYIYSQNQRMIEAVEDGNTLGEYVYNGNGQRVKKTTVSGTIVFHYDLQGHILAESDDVGTIRVEYVFLNGSPYAKIEGTNVYYYHNDHLGTPQKMTDAGASVVWYGEFLPFGEPGSINGTITNNIRFPGQYRDQETGLHYNYFRVFDSLIGRYIEADPTGILNGMNHLYVYVVNSPVNRTDPEGNLPPPVWGAIGIGIGFAVWEFIWWYNQTHPPKLDECELKGKEANDQVPGSPGMTRNFPPYQPPPNPPPPITGR